MASQSIDTKDISEHARLLIKQLADGILNERGIGSMSPAIYDTAWVSMISKPAAGGRRWLFPDSFEFILNTQTSEGGWDIDRSDLDSILNTLAALLAMKMHAANPSLTVDGLGHDIGSRISKATVFLGLKLEDWDVDTSRHVGFEILIPSLLENLKHEGISFDFPGRRSLMMLNRKKLANFDPEILYSTRKTTLIHSLEAFHGSNIVDYDRISHHKVFGSTMASPSSTAAYLMNSSIWDEEAESYIRTVIADGEGKGSGGVPSAFPCTIFEISWVVSTLLESGFSIESLGSENILSIAGYLEKCLQDGNGLAGFAPHLLADADDTAKVMLILNLLNKSVLPDQMNTEFGSESHFKTYAGERDASFSANCNVLNALFHVPNPSRYETQICTSANFLCDSWWTGSVDDKWNLSPEYSMMLLVQSLTRFLHLWDEGQLTALSDPLIRDRVPIVLLQALVRTLQRQNANGSWGSNQSSEETAYAVLFLVSIFGIPWVRFLEPQITSAIEAGRLYLNQYCEGWTKPAPLWIEKVSYGSGVLSQAYCISAINAPISTCQGWGEAAKNLIDVKMEAVTKFSQFFSHLPLFCQEPSWKLRAAVVEGYLFLPHLKRVRLNIFPRKEMAEDKYLEYIPFTWIASNYRGGGYLSTKLMWDMMIISMLNYQADEYMEAVVGTQLKDNLEIAKRIVEKLIRETNGLSYGVKESPVDTSAVSTYDLASIAETDGVINISQIEKTLTRFITYVLDHPQVQSSSALDQQILRRELQNFLLAHIAQIENNLRFSDQEFSYTIITPFVAPKGTYHKWVHTTSADDTSCPYSFAFMSCLTANPGEDRFPSVQSKYISQDLCRHLATMCRQYNDYGSIARDRAEKNLNSVNLPEFHHNNIVKQEGSVENQNDVREEAFKAALFEIADYERDCLLFAMQKLGEAVPKQMGIWKTFVNVTDLYGQIYVARDNASRMR